MSPGLLLAIACAGGLASVLRYLLDAAFPSRPEKGPFCGQAWGLWIVNVLGSVLVVVVTVTLPTPLSLVLATGFCGGLTTFSSWFLGTFAWLRGQEKFWTPALISWVGQPCVALGCALITWWILTAL